MRSFTDFLSEASGTQLSAKRWLHGTGADVHPDRLRAPLFLTTSEQGARWYAMNRGGTTAPAVHAFHVGVRQPFTLDGYASAVQLQSLLSDAGLSVTLTNDPRHGWTWQCDAVAQVSPYDGDNPMDIVYVPAAIRALQRAGYDALYTPSDVLNDVGEIEALVVFDLNQITALNEQVKSFTAFLTESHFKQGFVGPQGEIIGLPGEDHTDTARRLLKDGNKGVNDLLDRGYVRFWRRNGEIDLNFRSAPASIGRLAGQRALDFLHDNYEPGDAIYLDMIGHAAPNPFFNALGLANRAIRSACGMPVYEAVSKDTFIQTGDLQRGTPVTEAFDPNKLRALMNTTTYPGETRFLLPDGTRLRMADERGEHSDAIAPYTLDAVLRAGVVRVRPEVGVHCRSRITQRQAEIIADDWTAKNEPLHIDCELPPTSGYRLDYKVFDPPINARTLRAWVNKHFNSLTGE